MITFTRCAFMAKQACATFSQVVQKITPPIANNFLKFFFALFAMLALNAATAWAETKTEGFEEATTSTNYKGTVTVNTEQSDCGIGWTIYYGCVSTTSKISGNNSAALRLYTSNNYGYLKTTTPIDGLSKVTFNAKAATSNSAKIKVNISYSKDGSTWTNIKSDETYSTTSQSKSYDIPSGGKYFQIAISSNSTKPTKNNAQLTIDDVVFTYTATSTPVDPIAFLNGASYTVGQTLDLSTLWTSNSDGAVTYSIVEAGTTGASINGKSFTATATGTCTVKASQAATSAYNAITKTATITVTAPTPANPYKVTLEAGPGTCAESVTEASAGAGVSLPTPTLDCGDWEFAGWTTSSVATETTSKPSTLLTGKYNPTANITLYAVYQRTETTEGAGTTEVTKTVSISDYASAKNWNNDNRYTTVNIDANITATASSDPATNTGKYYSNDNSWRFYQTEEGKLTITANEGITLKSITLTFTNKDSGTISYNNNSCTSNTAISVSGQSATFNVGSSSGSKGKILITKISVTYESTSGGASTTYYHSTPECAAPCTDVVTISKGTPSNGSFKLDKTGEQSTCNGAVTVTLSDIQPADGYQFSTITQSGVDDAKVTIDNVAKTVTYAQNTTGESTINITFTPIEYTLSLESALKCVENGSITITYNATSAKTFTAATRDDYTCTGYWSAPSGGVQVLKADGTFVGDVSGFISGGKWVNTTATKLTPRWETEYKMTLSKGEEENGTYILSTSSIETSGCATSTTRQVTITATPVAGYEVDQITYSGDGTATITTGPTISAGKTTWVYTFAENDKGLGTFIVTFKQLPKYTVTWMANEQQHAAQTSVVGTSLTNPGDPEASTYACDDKVFVGWTAEKNYSNTTTAPDDLFKSAEATSKTIPENGITYYAVFANATTIPSAPTTTEETATLSFENAAQRESISSAQQVWKQNGIVFTNNQANSDNPVADYVDPVRCYKNSDIILDCSELGNITKVQFKCTSSEYASDLASSIGSEASTSTTWVTLIPKTETKVYEISLSSGQTRISSLTVTYEKTIVNDPTVTYSNYSTICVPAPKLVSIAQTAGQIEFTEGDEFVKATITATYEDESTKDVTSKATFSTPDMTQVGEQTISVSYKEGEVTAETSYKINIKEKTKYTIAWWANGEKYHTQKAVEGTAIDVPTNSPNAATYACDDKVFVGWVDAEISGSTDTKPTLITDFDKITENKDFFAVFASESSTDHPTAYTAGEVGDFVLAAKNGDKWYALPTNPVVNSGKIQGVEIPVTTTNGVEHVTTANASGYTWTIANATNGQTISDGTKYIYHKNGGESETDLSYGIGTSFTWKIEKEDAGLTFKAMNGATVNNRGMLVQGTQYGGYSLSNETTNGYYRISVLPIADAVSYSGYVTTCEATTQALSGKFSTGKYEYAEFATGNLQYKPSTDTWRFAKQQYQYVGEANINVGDPNYKGWIDMFGWSADGKFGVNPSCNKELYTGDFVDWGTQIGEGWLTLTETQWKYLLNERPNHSTLKQIAMVGETRGIMLFPDNWTETIVEPTYDDELKVDVYKYNLVQWADLEANGVIFLPAAGRRFGGYGNTYNANGENIGSEYKIQYKTNYFACYWTSTKHNDAGAASYLFNYATSGDSYKYSNLNLGWYEYGHAGHSVRLAKVTNTLIQLGSDDNREVIETNAGQKVNVQVNRTFKANDGYYTLCLPFDLDAGKIGKALQISSITENVAEQGMNVVFTEVTNLVAGQPYLVLPSKNLTNPIFEGVKIVDTEGETTETVSGAGINITFTGIINGVGEQTNGSTEYWVGNGGYLYNDKTAKLGLRAFFTITDAAGQAVKNVRARVVVGENATTGVDNSQLPITNIQKVIENGQLIIIRNGEKFNAQGIKL